MSDSHKNSTDAYNQSLGGVVQKILPGIGIAVNDDNPLEPTISADLAAGPGIEVYTEEESNKVFIKNTKYINLAGYGIQKIDSPDRPLPEIYGIDQYYEIQTGSSAAITGGGFNGAYTLSSTPTYLDITEVRTFFTAFATGGQKNVVFTMINFGRSVCYVTDTGKNISGFTTFMVPPKSMVKFILNVPSSGTNWTSIILPISTTRSDMVQGNLFTTTTTTTVVNTTVETFGNTTPDVGISTILNNTLVKGRVLEGTAFFSFSNTAPNTLTIRFKFGGTAFAALTVTRTTTGTEFFSVNFKCLSTDNPSASSPLHSTIGNVTFPTISGFSAFNTLQGYPTNADMTFTYSMQWNSALPTSSVRCDGVKLSLG